MARTMKYLLPLLLLGVILLFSFGSGVIKRRKKPNKVISFIILGFGATIDIITTILIVKQNESNRICNASPGCMNESGMLYIFFGFLLFIGTVFIFIGLVNVIKAYKK